MTVKTGSAWAGLFVTLDATGAKAASTNAAGTLYIDGTADAATVTITGSNPYKWAVTLPALTAGQRVDMYITGTIGTVATAGIVASAQADTSLLSDVKTDTAAILADTGTDGVLLSAGTGAKQISLSSGAVLLQATQTGVTIPTVTTLTNLPDAPTDWLTAAAVKADAVTKLQANLALEATLTAIKGAGWTNETLAKIVVDISNIAAGSGATAQEVWEYATRVLTAGTNIDLSSLATAANLATLDGKVDTVDGIVDDIWAQVDGAFGSLDAGITTIIADTNELQTDLTNGGRLDLLIDAIKAKTDNLPADPADDSDIDTAIAAVKTVVDAIKTEIDGHPTAAEVWSYGTRTLTTAVAGAVIPATGDTLEITKDSTVIINLTGLGDIHEYTASTSGQEDKVWFTAKKSLDDTDASSIIQIFTLYPAGNTPPDTLTYINGVAATATEGTFQFTDLVAGNATITLAAAAAADLPIYAVSPLYWDVKILKYSTGVVSILASGEMYIYGTPTISIS
jgi:hypothetical protein